MEKKGSALYLCPGCGAFVSESASKCPNCGNVLEGSADDDLDLPDEMNVQETTAKAEPEIVEPEKEFVDDESESVTLFMCSSCGAFTGGDADNCPNCGTSMHDDEEDVGPLIKPGDPESGLLDMLVATDADSKDAENLLEDLKKIESTEDVENFIESIPYKDPDLILEIGPQDNSLPERSEEMDDLLSQLVLASDDEIEPEEPERTAKAVQTVRDTIEEPRGAHLGDNETIAMCSSCGAFVSESAEVCNVCGNALKGEKKFIPGVKSKKPVLDRSGEEAESIMRTLLGVKGDTELDSDTGSRFQSDGNLNLCTLCGAFISQNAEACPVCGTHIEDMPEFVPSIDLAGPEKETHGLALCPHCGVFVQEGAKECFSCVKPIPDGAKLATFQDEFKEDEADRASNLLKTFLGVEKALTKEPLRDPTFSGLDLCPDCGAFVSAQAITCSVCGNPLFEGAGEIEDINRQIDEIGELECPNCGTKIIDGSLNCSLCGIVFGSAEALPIVEGPAEDISDFLETELEDTIRSLEEKSIEKEQEIVPQPHIQEAEKDELQDMLILDELVPDELHEETGADEGGLESILEDITELEVPVEESIEVIQSAEQEILEPVEFIEQYEAEPIAQEAVEEINEIPFLEEDIATEKSVERLPAFESHSFVASKPANWVTGVYVSIATICIFVAFYLIKPGGAYAPGLAIIFGLLLLIGVYLGITDKATLFKGDLKQASVFIAGTIVAGAVLLHWPAGLLTSESGVLGQPALDRLLLSLSILLLSIGLLWIRARVRYIFIWFSGTSLLFLATLMQFTYSGFTGDETSPILLVSGLGACLVFMSLIFLQYERALHTSIESDIVRGDAHYMKRDYKRALVSYDDALAKAEMKSVEALGSPMIQYDVPWYSKGSALILMGQPEEGIKCLDMALAINPNNEVTWVNKGNAHSKLGEQDIARDCYRRAIESNPNYEIAWNNMGNVFARQKDYIEALKHYNRAIKINSKYDDAWINKGYVLAKMGKREEAIKCLNHVGSRAKGQIPPMEKDVHTL